MRGKLHVLHDLRSRGGLPTIGLRLGSMLGLGIREFSHRNKLEVFRLERSSELLAIDFD